MSLSQPLSAPSDQRTDQGGAEPISDPGRFQDDGEAVGAVGACEPSELWLILSSDDKRPLSLRAIWPKHLKPCRPAQNVTFTAQGFPSGQDRRLAFDAKASELNATGYNVYVVMNPIREDFTRGAVRDADIAFRDLLLIDIDRAGATDCPASEDEMASAYRLADQVVADPALDGLQLLARVMSGNGVHLYYHLGGMPNDDASKRALQELLQLLARKFDNDAVQIDPSVFNASRITKVPGTIARKGEESLGRPYRMARVL